MPNAGEVSGARACVGAHTGIRNDAMNYVRHPRLCLQFISAFSVGVIVQRILKGDPKFCGSHAQRGRNGQL